MNKVFLECIINFSVLFQIKGQERITTYRNEVDSSFNSYVLVKPVGEKIKGLIVRDYSKLPDFSKKSRYQWMNYALEENMAVLFTVTSNYFPELCYDDNPSVILDSILNEVLSNYPIPKNNVFVGGISASGTRALQFVKFCQQGKSKFGITPAGAFICDSPLDFERFYYSAEEILIRNHPNGMNEEARWMIESFPLKLGGTPSEVREKYLRASVFSYRELDGGSAQYYSNTPIIMFHEPDMDWWLNERNAVYTDINSFDIIGFERAIKNLGNNDVTVVSTTGKGFDSKGERNCHSWTIVDERLLIDWIIERCSN